MTPTRLPRSLTSRLGTIVAVTIGFGVGAAGFAAAQHDDPLPAPASTTVATSSTTTDDGPTTTIDGGPVTTIEDRPSTTVDDGPTTTIDDGPSTATEDRPSTTVDDGPTTTIDDGPTTTIEDRPSTTLAAALPAPFTTTYSSSGGSINVTWSGTAFTLNAISPAPGFRAEIEDQAWDRIRVDFDGEDVDARIEVRLNDGSLRVRVD